MPDTETKIKSFEEMEKASGPVAAANAYFSVHGNLPEEKFPGQWHELVGDQDLGEDVETWIKNNCPR